MFCKSFPGSLQDLNIQIFSLYKPYNYEIVQYSYFSSNLAILSYKNLPSVLCFQKQKKLFSYHSGKDGIHHSAIKTLESKESVISYYILICRDSTRQTVHQHQNKKQNYMVK